MMHLIGRLSSRSLIGFGAATLLLASFGGASIIGPSIVSVRPIELDPAATSTVEELQHLGLLRRANEKAVEDLLLYQRRTGKSLAQIVKDPTWRERLGLTALRFKATWYAANPFDLLPTDLKKAISDTPKPFLSRRQLEAWCRQRKAPAAWMKALDNALVETTPENLWRASRGQRPYAKNGKFLEPIVVEQGAGRYAVRDGHIATDPRIIPTNSEVLLLVRVHGKDRLLRVVAADIGSAIQGRHVDLPIQIRPESTRAVPFIRFPKEYIRNPTVEILMPVSPNQKG